jgi:6-phosphogluconolactonase
MSKPLVRIFEDSDELAAAAAEQFAALAEQAIAARGVFHAALSGGSTPKRMFEYLAARVATRSLWPHVELWWGDERPVAPDHVDSNYRMARLALIDPLASLGPLGLDPAHLHRMRGELVDHDQAARLYQSELVAVLGTPPVLDLVLLGMGPDGHTASLFPGSPAVAAAIRAAGPSIEAAAPRWVVANPVSSPLVGGVSTRITLTAAALNAARHIRFVVAGADKAATLAEVLEGPFDPARYPVQLVAPPSGELVWLLDRASAAQLGDRSGIEEVR